MVEISLNAGRLLLGSNMEVLYSQIFSHVLLRLAASVHIGRFGLTLASNGPGPICCLWGME